jgi:hypothetical protein
MVLALNFFESIAKHLRKFSLALMASPSGVNAVPGSAIPIAAIWPS